MKKIILSAGLILCAAALSAQEKGYLTGSFETTDHIYVEDEANRFIPSDDRFGSNNYLKLDYYNGKFSAGMQIEGYLPSAVGYPCVQGTLGTSTLRYGCVHKQYCKERYCDKYRDNGPWC